MKSNIAVIEADSVIVSMQRASLALVEAKTIQQTKKIMDVAAAAEIYARRQKLGQEAEDLAASIKVEALRKLGEMLQTAPKARGAKTVGGDKRSGGTVSAPPEDDAPTLADLGLTKKESAVAQKLAALPEAEFQQVRDGHVAVSKAIAAVTAAKPRPVAPTEPEKPADRMAELERERDGAVRAMNEALAENTSMGEAFDADDRTAALFAENQKLRAQVATLTQRVNGLMNEKNEAVRAAKSWQRKAQQVATA